jgi:hypothetical protein
MAPAKTSRFVRENARMMVMRKLITAEAYAVMIERSSSRQGFLYRRGGNLLFFGVQFIVVLGIVLIVE